MIGLGGLHVNAGNEWRIDGFREVRELGSGAQGRVVLARHHTAGTPVAIKYLTRGSAQDLERLRDEAVLLGRVTDPHVARLYRLVEGQHGAAIVMEAVNGVSLKRVLSEHGALGAEASLTVLKGSLQGLAAAHAVGVVHRDYKPANVVVQSDGLSKLIDFGIAVPYGEDGRSGTPAYMAPEQWRGEPATPAADVYAATCVFFECVTGQRPFRGASGPELMGRHLNEDVPLGMLPEALRELVARGTAKEAAARPYGAAAFVDELDRAAVAAYGADWEQRGVRALAGSAVALAALFPLVAAGISTPAPVAAGSAATAGGTVAASGVVGGGVSAGGAGVAAGVGGKVALAVAGTVLAAGSGAAVVGGTMGDDEEPEVRPRTRTVSASIETYEATFGRTVIQNAQYARVSGLRDPQLQKRINKESRTPLDSTIERMRAATQQTGQRCTRNSEISSTASLGLEGPTLVSAVYKVQAHFCMPSDGMMPGWAVTVNVKTGKALSSGDVFKAGTLTSGGTRRLIRRLTREDGGRSIIWGPDGCRGGYPERADFFRTDEPALRMTRPPALTAFFAPDRFVLNFSVEGSSCTFERLEAPYSKVKDLLKPGLVTMLPDGPAPQRT